ncbi:hypothetical protein AhaeAN54_009775 [Acinetobacter haemolyticus]|nr:hypothetical protein AhaeAN54_009775 [Acinetobacter haemolyticus]
MNIATKFTPRMIATKDVSLDDKYISDDGTAYMTGIQAEPYRVCRRVNILRDYPDDKTKLYPRN